jgi:hypothetical protein
MAEPTRAASSPGQGRLNVGDLVYRTGDDRLWRVLAVYDDGATLIECVAEAWNRFKFEPAADLRLAG